MKKLLCILLTIAVLFSFAACGENDSGKGDNVTIYIPDTVTSLSSDGTQQLSLQYVFEEGWQNKESFTAFANVNDPDGLLGDAANAVTMITVVYSEKRTVQETTGTSRIEAVFDENGRTVSTTTTYLIETTAAEKTETFLTYDEFGRVAAQETKTYNRGETEPQTATATYAYTETDTGSKCEYTEHSIAYVRVYDKNYRQVCDITIVNGEEMSRTEREYDAAGNLTKMISYYNGEKMSETQYTYKTAEVSAEFAQRMPQFKKAN